jgi:predicted Ser/Thr protein kinase
MVSPGQSREPMMVGPYRLIQRLGEGGMGVVHLALDPAGKAVAIKVLRPHIAADPDARRRLEREVATLRRVRHPRVAAVIDADVEGDVPYVVTTFVPGKPLDTYVKEHGRLPRGHVARVGKVLAEALRAIHDSGVVHRDVKPANVMMLDGEPILIDFGIAHVADESRITHTGLVMGTPGYLSPEIIGGDEVSTATDWWGWGATLAFAATGRAPFGTGPIEVVLDRVRRGQSDLDGVDDGLRRTLTQALSVDPSHRPPPEVLVAGLAAVPPVRPRPVLPPALDVMANPALDRAPAFAPDDTTVRVPPPVAPAPAPSEGSDDVTMVVSAPTRRTPGPGTAFRASDPDATTTRVPPPVNGFGGSPAADAGPRTDVLGHPWTTQAGYGEGAGGQAIGGQGVSGQGVGGQGASGQDFGGQDSASAGAWPVLDPATARRGVLLGVLLVLSLLAAVAPTGAVTIVWVLLSAMRVTDHVNTSLLLRRQQFGQRGSDAWMIGITLPWRVVVSLLVSLVLLVLPVLIGVSVTFIAASVWAGSSSQAIPAEPGSLAFGMAALLLTSWYGPGGGAVRRGARQAARAAVRGRRSQLTAWALIGLFVVAAITVVSGQESPDWGAFEGTWLVRFLNA